ncbi:UNVERIFIED_CONTAM: hypothetical protein FKN15_023855 [Acipenser sinensis]
MGVDIAASVGSQARDVWFLFCKRWLLRERNPTQCGKRLSEQINAWSHGDPRKVIYPTDSRGQFCGQAGTELEKTPFLFYFNIMKCASPLVLLEFQCPTTQICVEKCPDKFMTLLKAYANPSDMDYYKKFCKPEFAGMTKLSAPEVLRDGYCPAMLIPSRPFTRRCFPALRAKKGMITIDNHTTFDDGMGERRNVTDLLEGAKKANVVLEARQVAMKIFEDYTVSWHWILLKANVVLEARQVAMKIFEDYTVSWHWILLGLVIAMVISLIFVVLLRFLAGIMVWVMIVLVLLVLGYGEEQYSLLLAAVIILCIIEVVIILLLIFLRKRIVIAIALIKEASSFLSTSNEPVYKVFPNNTNNESSCIYSRKTCDPQFYNVFLFFWCANFVTALGQVTLAGAFASFYWAFKKPDDMPAFPIFTSLGRALRYHTGSLAFGSLILSIVQVIRVLLEYLDHKLKVFGGVCFVYGQLSSDHPTPLTCNLRSQTRSLRVAVLNKVTEFLLFLGKLLIVGSVGILSFFFFSGRIKPIEDTAPTLNYYWVPILTVVIGSYFIAHGFFSVYGMCVDTLFLCFLEDLERNDGSQERPYFMPDTLLKALKKKNEAKPSE